jgi:hypothetical protein
MVGIGSIWLRIGTGGGLMWTRWWTSGFHKMLGSSQVAAQLAASPEGLSSMSEWVSEWVSLLLIQKIDGFAKNVHWTQNVRFNYCELLFGVHFASTNIKRTALETRAGTHVTLPEKFHQSLSSSNRNWTECVCNSRFLENSFSCSWVAKVRIQGRINRQTRRS